MQLILMVSREASNVLPVEEHEGQGLSLDFLFSNPRYFYVIIYRVLDFCVFGVF